MYKFLILHSQREKNIIVCIPVLPFEMIRLSRHLFLKSTRKGFEDRKCGSTYATRAKLFVNISVNVKSRVKIDRFCFDLNSAQNMLLFTLLTV